MYWMGMYRMKSSNFAFFLNFSFSAIYFPLLNGLVFHIGQDIYMSIFGGKNFVAQNGKKVVYMFQKSKKFEVFARSFHLLHKLLISEESYYKTWFSWYSVEKWHIQKNFLNIFEVVVVLQMSGLYSHLVFVIF